MEATPRCVEQDSPFADQGGVRKAFKSTFQFSHTALAATTLAFFLAASVVTVDSRQLFNLSPPAATWRASSILKVKPRNQGLGEANPEEAHFDEAFFCRNTVPYQLSWQIKQNLSVFSLNTYNGTQLEHEIYERSHVQNSFRNLQLNDFIFRIFLLRRHVICFWNASIPCLDIYIYI